MKIDKKSLAFPAGTSFAEYKGNMYVTHPKHGVRRLIVDNEGNISVEEMLPPKL